MKKLIFSALALVALSSAAFAQSSPFVWQAGENTTVKLGGYIRSNINYDFDGCVGEANDFQASKISSSSSWTDESYLNFDVTASRLSLEVTHATSSVGDIKVFVEADFRGSGNTARLRQAYIQMGGLITGYAWSFMSDLAASAPTVDITGVGSRTFLRTQMIGFRTSLGETMSAGIALETPSLTTDYMVGGCSVNQTVPNIPIYIQYKSSIAHLKAAAAFRSLQYGDSIDQERYSSFGWGAQLSGSYKAARPLTLYGQAIYGAGINNYINDLSSLPINLQSPGGTEMEATPMGGASLGACYKISKRISIAASGSYVENFGDAEWFEDGYYKNSSYISGTIFYAPAPRITIGAEYLRGTRTDFGDDAIDAQRLSLSFKYTL